MKKLLYLLALLLPLAGFTQNTRAFYGSSISRSYGVDTLAGFKAINTNTLGYAGLVAISAADTSVFFTNGTGHANIYNSAGVLRQPQYVGVGGSPDVSGTAYLSLTGTTGGFLTARMTAAQKNAIGSPATGLLIYQTDGTAGFYYYNGSAWGAVGGASGITVGTTTITSGTTLRIPYNLAGVYQEQANFTIGSVATGFLDVPVGYARAGAKFIVEDLTTLNSSLGTLAGAAMRVNTTLDGQQQGCIYIGQEAGRYLGSQYTGHNTVIGYKAFSNSGSVGVDNQDNTVLGYKSASGWTGSNHFNTIIGTSVGTAAGSIIRQSTYVGANIATVYTNSGAFGYGAQPTAANQFVIGNAAAAAGTGVFDNVYFNGVTFTSPAPIVLNAAGGSGSNVSGASFTISGGKGTGTGTGGSFVVKTSTTLGTGTTLQSLVSRLTISGGAVTTDASTATWADALDFVFGSTTGTKIGTATTQKIGFWNATPIVQPTTAITAAAFVSNTSLIADDSATFGGYTIGQIVAALKSAGLLQ